MIRFDALRAGYDGAECLHGITCSVLKGRLTALIGPNGCGKSTLIKCTAGLLKPYSGDILLEEQSCRSLSLKEMARLVSYMPQTRSAPSIPVRQLVSHGRYPYLQWGHSMTAVDRKIVQDALERTETLPYADRLVSQLSGGERQRVYVAMMLAQQTPVMLLDEPTAHLDLGAQFALMSLLRELSEEGRTILIVLHDLALALEYADQLILMQDGCLLQCGSPAETADRLGEVFGILVTRTPEGKYVFSPGNASARFS